MNSKSIIVGTCSLMVCSAFAQKTETANDGVVDSLEELRDLFEEHQFDWTELALPGDATLFQDYVLVVPFRPENLPKKFSRRLVGEYNSDGIPLYKITCIEDWETREVVLFDTFSGLAIWRLDADPYHDPYAFLRLKYGLSWYDAFDGVDAYEILRLDSAKIAADFTLVPVAFYADYILAEEQRRLDAVAAMPMMMSSPAWVDPTNVMVGMENTSAGIIELELVWPSNYAGRLEIYAESDLMSNDWQIVSEKMPVAGSRMYWQDMLSTNLGKRFYSAGDPDTDTDGDGFPNGRERLFLGTSPFSNDSDGDGLLEYEEARMQTYAAEAIPFQWVDIELPGNAVTNWLREGYDGYALDPVGFEFPYYENLFTNFYISRCGYLRFGYSSRATDNEWLPNLSEPNNLIAVFWDRLDMEKNSNATVYAETLGSEPFRSSVVTWKAFPLHADDLARLTFQVELREQGEIIFRYFDMDNGTKNDATGLSATAGMQDDTRRDGTTWSYNTDSLTNGLAVRFHYAPTFHQNTDPANWDTDGDGMDDGFETDEYPELDPLDPVDGSGDHDGDGLSNALEYQIGTDYLDKDTDDDSLNDWGEYTFGLNPTNALSTDLDTDSDFDGMTNRYEVVNHLDPFDAADKELDWDNDGLSNIWECTNGLSASQWDTDGDTLADGQEVLWGTNPAVSNDLSSDLDLDGLVLSNEYFHGTNPFTNNTDGDATNDGDEVAQGSSPTNPGDGGAPPEEDELVPIKLTVGDHSGSHSEMYLLLIEGERTIRHENTMHGIVEYKDAKLRKGQTYTITLQHLGTTEKQMSDYGEADFDYTANIEVSAGSVATIIFENTAPMFGEHGDGGNTSSGPFDSEGKITATMHVLSTTLKVTHPQTSASSAYSNSPGEGSANNLFSTWPGEQFRVDVHIEPDGLAQNLPDDYIEWMADGFTIPNNSTTFTFSWSTTETKTITVKTDNVPNNIHVHVPDVGDQSEQAALANVEPLLARALIASSGIAARDFCSTNYTPAAERDAMRHAMWNALAVSSSVSANDIEAVTKGHEYDNWLASQTAWSSTMDLKNNEVGRNAIHTTPAGQADQAAIAADLEGKYANGEMWIWTELGAGASEGILIKSDGTKIYSTN